MCSLTVIGTTLFLENHNPTEATGMQIYSEGTSNMVELGRKVKLLYTASFEDGTVFDSSDLHNGNPLEFVVGTGQVIPGLEKAVMDMNAYEKRTITITPKDAYGVYDEKLIEKIPSKDFPHVQDLPVGEYIMLSLPEKRTRVKVMSVDSDYIVLDFNHEFADRSIIFEIELIEIFGETGSAVENEKHAADCSCGCQILKKQLSA